MPQFVLPLLLLHSPAQGVAQLLLLLLHLLQVSRLVPPMLTTTHPFPSFFHFIHPCYSIATSTAHFTLLLLR